jgi:hypothetical protein
MADAAADKVCRGPINLKHPQLAVRRLTPSCSTSQIELWKLYNIMAAQQPVAAQNGAAASSTHTCVPVDPLLYRPHGPLNVSGSSSSGVAVMGEGRPMPLWEQDAWGYPYPTNR